MTAPGNSALLISLLAVFVACSGYAAGRLHQRYQMERDREEAYRDGYDTATRSVFSLAARVIAPRRAVRAAVPVAEPPAPPPSSPLSPAPGGPGPAGLLRRSAVPGVGAAAGAAAAQAEPEPPLGFPAPPPPSPRVVAEPAAVGGVVYQPFPDQGTDDAPSPPEVDPPAEGRHTVPDELVKAATYRLPADRVFRAKVPDSAALPEEPTTRLSVPKPRHS